MTARCKLDLFLFFAFVCDVSSEREDDGIPGEASVIGSLVTVVMCDGTMIGVWRGGGGHYVRISDHNTHLMKENIRHGLAG